MPLESSITPELMLTFPLAEPTEFHAEEGGKLPPLLYLLPSAACSPEEPSHCAEERAGKENAGRRGVVLVGALSFKSPERFCVGQDTFASCLKCKFLEGWQGFSKLPRE